MVYAKAAIEIAGFTHAGSETDYEAKLQITAAFITAVNDLLPASEAF